jgi:spore coat polysaccharide biosynthesis protein SpsF (cytidylyltransferase family)
MKIGILITARLGSTRLKEKHLLRVNNKPLILYLIERIQRELHEEIKNKNVQIIIATSDEQENRKFEILSKVGVSIFYGSVNNIPLRHSQAGIENGVNAIVSIDGDDILCSPKGMREIYKALSHGAHYVKTSNLPFGMNSFGYSFSFLKSAIENHSQDTLETGWGRIFDESQLKDIAIPCSIRNNALRFTLDYEEDFQFFKALIEKCGDKIVQMMDEEIIDIVFKYELFKINEQISKQYWENFYRFQKQEIEQSKGNPMPEKTKERL